MRLSAILDVKEAGSEEVSPLRPEAPGGIGSEGSKKGIGGLAPA